MGFELVSFEDRTELCFARYPRLASIRGFRDCFGAACANPEKENPKRQPHCPQTCVSLFDLRPRLHCDSGRVIRRNFWYGSGVTFTNPFLAFS